MTAVVDEPTTAATEAPEQAGGKKSRVSREQVILLTALPALVAVTFGLWAWWRATADLDPIEARQLAWGTLSISTLQHASNKEVSTA